MNLKDRAIAAHKEQQEYEAEKEAKRFAKRAQVTEKAFQETFGEHLPVAPGTCDTVLAKDGLRFRATFNYSYSHTIGHFALFGACPDCGVACYSRGIYNLGDLGKQIAEFIPQYGHKCAPTIHCPTVGETLLEGLQNYIGEICNE